VQGARLPAGSRAEPLREVEGSAIESEAKPNEQNALRQIKGSGEYRYSKIFQFTCPRPEKKSVVLIPENPDFQLISCFTMV